jgi:CDP-6-deoxy-D-xylo-4-hexulose-3-dehydrase
MGSARPLDKAGTLEAIRTLIENYQSEHVTYAFDPANPQVRLHEPTFGADEICEALESLLTTQVTMGAKVRRFEREFSQHFGFPYSMMVNSGSSANLLAVAGLCNPAMANGLRPGDEVIVPALSWSTTIWPLIQHGLVPVIVDIDPTTLNIDPNEIERAISDKTRGIMLVHVYGNPCDMDAISQIVERHSLILIEDCCEALDASYGGRPVGSFGRVGTFSFYFSHHITTLEGGMCVTGDIDCAEMIRILRAHGWVRETDDQERYTNEYPDIDPRFLFVNLGYNLRPTELQGGFGYVQLNKLKSFVDIRKDNARFWANELGHLKEFLEFQEETPQGSHSWFGFPMGVRGTAPFSVGELCVFLNGRGIETRPIIAGNIAAQPALRHYDHRVVGDLPRSSHVMTGGFTFGNHQAIDENARQYVADAMKDFLAERGLS